MSKTRTELVDLLLQRAAAGLSEPEEERLSVLLAEEGFSDEASIELAVAAAWNAFSLDAHADPDIEIPDRLKDRLAADVDAFFDARERAKVIPFADRTAPRMTRLRAWSGAVGWAIAAMMTVVLTLILTGSPEVPELVAARAELLDVSGTATRPWKESTLPAYRGVEGDVVWNDERQAGFLRLTGMPVNNVAKEQYQLWIVDPERDSNPIDGGVFDIPAGVREVVIRIDAKLPVSEPKAFAITREKPGGVVVSEGPLLVVTES